MSIIKEVRAMRAAASSSNSVKKLFGKTEGLVARNGGKCVSIPKETIGFLLEQTSVDKDGRHKRELLIAFVDAGAEAGRRLKVACVEMLVNWKTGEPRTTAVLKGENRGRYLVGTTRSAIETLHS